MRLRSVLVPAALGLLAVPVPAGADERFVTVDQDARSLLLFNADSPTNLVERKITGLSAVDSIAALDRRPADGQIYGVTENSDIVRVDINTGAATRIGSVDPEVDDARAGWDWNPVADRVRYVGPNRVNARVNPLGGTVEAVDKPLFYAAGDRNEGQTPIPVDVAYTNAINGATFLGMIDAQTDALVVQHPPNDGVLRTIGTLGLDVQPRGGFDIAGNGTPWAALRPPNQKSMLASIDLQNGRAARRGDIGIDRKVVGLTALGTPPADTRGPRIKLNRPRLSGKRLSVNLTCSEACSVKVTVRAARRVLETRKAGLDTPGGLPLRVRLSAREVAAVTERGGRVTVTGDDYRGNDAKRVTSVIR